MIENSTNPIEDSDNSEWTACDNSDDMRQSEESMEVMRQKMGEIQDRNDKDSINNASVPKTSDEWRMWYPCPECQSTALEQVTEQHLSVSATEDGSYGGDVGGIEEYNYVECRDCGEVLLDEIGRN